MKELNEAWQRGKVNEEGFFSYRSCGICKLALPGYRYLWHAIRDEGREIRKNDPILHFENACEDCWLYISNGDEPDEPEE
jgi:hypothetical protein